MTRQCIKAQTRPGTTQAGGIALWWIDLADVGLPLEKLHALLSEDEQARAERFLGADLRRHFVVAHAAVRLILAERLTVTPHSLEFELNEFGKPFLKGATSLVFNLSHAGEWALCALAGGGELGVDIERCRELAQDELAERFFADSEVQALRALPSALRQEGFLACWTRKESYIKAKGHGLSLPLDTFSVLVDPRQPPALLSSRLFPADADAFKLWALPAPAGYHATLAYRGDALGPPQQARWVF